MSTSSRRVEWTGACQPPGQILAVQKLHDEEGLVPFGAHVGDVDRVGVTHLRGQLRFTQEPRARPFHRGDGGRQHLDRDVFADLRVDRLVHRAHATRAEAANDLVFAETRPRRELRFGGRADLSGHDND